MIFSLIVLAFIVYVLLNTKINGDKVASWIIVCAAILTMTSPFTALVVLGILAFIIYKGVRSGEIDTLDWIENLIK